MKDRRRIYCSLIIEFQRLRSSTTERTRNKLALRLLSGYIESDFNPLRAV